MVALPKDRARVQVIHHASVWMEVHAPDGSSELRPVPKNEVVIVPRDDVFRRLKNALHHIVEVVGEEEEEQ